MMIEGRFVVDTIEKLKHRLDRDEGGDLALCALAELLLDVVERLNRIGDRL